MACEPFDCSLCGEHHDRCVGHVVKCIRCGWSGGNTDPDLPCHKCKGQCERHPCRKWPDKYAPNCSAHGGEAAQVKAAAGERRADAKLVNELERLSVIVKDGPPVDDPFSVLAENAGQIQRFKEHLLRLIDDRPSLIASAGQHGIQLDPMVTAYFSAVEKADRLITSMAKLDLTARLAALHSAINAESSAKISHALESALASVSLEPEQRSAILTAFGHAMRAVSQEERAALPA